MKNRAITAVISAALGLILAASGSTALALSGMPTASAQAPRPAPTATYDDLTAREWALIAKDPDAHVGERYVVYGVVTQADAVTGAELLRADVDGIRHTYAYEYPTNTVLTGDAKAFADVVADDVFVAKVEVLGTITYETQLGGETTVPSLQVDSITVTPPTPS
ncbi:hypothetical protein [Streptomyces flavofungini]|uniref:hypothetical protein n=1 Tax=Streptomyces flavofungini TaxID=68200 RepID=UPI0025B11B6A|nr:hypothetical protein [Streptomyces flavofungini]WJV49065.1 hypothetical protein QUY26_28275 [Streptomyces flavofungini]